MAMPFEDIENAELEEVVNSSTVLDSSAASAQVRDYLYKLSNNLHFRNLDCEYYTTDEFNTKFSNSQGHADLSVIHLNIRSLNSKTQAFCTFMHTLELDFDLIILSEIWAYNIDFYVNLLKGYSLHTALPKGSNIGGVGIFIKDTLNFKVRSDLQLSSETNYKIEDLWIEAKKGKHM